jgi:putative membrane protein insertion efficiency factor
LKPNTAASSSAAAESSIGESDLFRRPTVAARFALVLLRAYKLLISPYFAGSCRFLPSCADYAREAILAHGAVRGSWLALRRLARCHPLCEGGHDPVPGTL